MNQIKLLEEYFDRLWPIARSITGPGYRESISILSELVPFECYKFPTGEEVFDWQVPNEWTPREAYFIGPDGIKRCNFSENNLHLFTWHFIPVCLVTVLCIIIAKFISAVK